MAAGTRAKGTRIFRAVAATAWVDLAAGANPAGAWVEVECPLAVSRPRRYETETYRKDCLNDAAEEPAVEKKPGGFSFRTKQTADTPTDKTNADAETVAHWAVLYKDGQAFTIKGYLVSEDDGSAENNLTAEVTHEYRVIGTEVGVWHDVAS